MTSSKKSIFIEIPSSDTSIFKGDKYQYFSEKNQKILILKKVMTFLVNDVIILSDALFDVIMTSLKDQIKLI